MFPCPKCFLYVDFCQRLFFWLWTSAHRLLFLPGEQAWSFSPVLSFSCLIPSVDKYLMLIPLRTIIYWGFGNDGRGEQYRKPYMPSSMGSHGTTQNGKPRYIYTGYWAAYYLFIYFFVTNLPGRVIETQFDFTLSPSKRASLLVSLATLASWRHNLATFQFNCKGPKAGWHHCTEQCQNIFWMT